MSVRAGRPRCRRANATLGARELHGVGELTSGGVHYEYVAFPVQAFPAGTATVEVFRTRRFAAAAVRRQPRSNRGPDAAAASRCLIYKGESGPRARLQVQRVQAYQPLLEAVANARPGSRPQGDRRAPAQARGAPAGEHADGALLADLGGPYVLAPLRAPLTHERPHRSANWSSRSRTTRATSGWPSGSPACTW